MLIVQLAMRRHAHRQELWKEILLVPHSYKTSFMNPSGVLRNFLFCWVDQNFFFFLQKLYSLWKAIQNISDVNFKMQFSTDKEKSIKSAAILYKVIIFFFFSSCTHQCNISCRPVGGDKRTIEEKFYVFILCIYLFICMHL